MFLLGYIPLGDEEIQDLSVAAYATVTLFTCSLSFSSAFPHHLILSLENQDATS